jgi:uncharacterized protein
MEGTRSLSIILSEHTEAVRALLKHGAVSRAEGCESFLIDRGFLIPEERDEDRHRRLRMDGRNTDSTLNLIIMPTEQCNFRCKYCYETFEKGKMDTTIQEALVKYVRKNIHKFTALHAGWFGGESLMALDVISFLSEEFIKICKTARKPYSSSMTTNGYHLTLDVYKKLCSYHVNNYQITLDGLETEHDRQRVLAGGGSTFQTIVQNLLDIRNNTRAFNTSIMVRTNYTKKIVSDLENYLQFYSENFGDDSRFSVYIHIASDWGGERVKNFSEEMLARSQYNNIVENIKRLKIPLNYQLHYNHLESGACVCYASKKNSIVIGSDGILYKCTNNFTYDKNKVGMLSNNGEFNYNENYYLWVTGGCSVDKKCEICFYSACCLFINCPAVKIKKIDKDICPFEKDNIDLFLELFDRKHFSTYKELRE